jgi:hypothetical protein
MLAVPRKDVTGQLHCRRPLSSGDGSWVPVVIWAGSDGGGCWRWSLSYCPCPSLSSPSSCPSSSIRDPPCEVARRAGGGPSFVVLCGRCSSPPVSPSSPLSLWLWWSRHSPSASHIHRHPIPVFLHSLSLIPVRHPLCLSFVAVSVGAGKFPLPSFVVLLPPLRTLVLSSHCPPCEQGLAAMVQGACSGWAWDVSSQGLSGHYHKSQNLKMK